MTGADRDRELLALFEAERRDDESAAPRLDALLARPKVRRAQAGGMLRQLDVAAALAAILAAAVLVLRSGARPPAGAPSPAAANEPAQLADWKSPTAFLLETPGSELLTQVPTFASPIAGGAAALRPTKGVER